jgi:hypothetical protein
MRAAITSRNLIGTKGANVFATTGIFKRSMRHEACRMQSMKCSRLGSLEGGLESALV